MTLLLMLLACSEPESDTPTMTDGENFFSCWPTVSAIPIPPSLLKMDTEDPLFVLHPPSQRLMIYENGKLIMKDRDLFCFYFEKGSSMSKWIEGWGSIFREGEYLKVDLSHSAFHIYSGKLSSSSSSGPHLALKSAAYSHVNAMLKRPYNILVLQ